MTEGSKEVEERLPKCPKCGHHIFSSFQMHPFGYVSFNCANGHDFTVSTIAEVAKFFPVLTQLTAILEENQRLRKRAIPPKELPRYTHPPDVCPDCDTHSFISDGPHHYVCYNCHILTLLDAAEAKLGNLQRIAPCGHSFGCYFPTENPEDTYCLVCEKENEAAEKLAKMREAFTKAAMPLEAILLAVDWELSPTVMAAVQKGVEAIRAALTE